MNNSPIGVFDSGMGGLSVWREIRSLLPHESIVYYGDGLNCPYGEKPPQQVLAYMEEAVETLLGAKAKLIVVACNTATMTGIKHLRNKYPIPFVGMEPALKPAAATTESGTVGVLATRAALGSDWFGELSGKYADGVRIITAVGDGFVEAVEAGEEDSPSTRLLVGKALRPLLDAGVDRIVLGCTHYPFLRHAIEEAVGNPAVTIIDPAPAVARRVESLLKKFSLAAGPDHVPHYDFLSAAGMEYVERVADKAGLL